MSLASFIPIVAGALLGGAKYVAGRKDRKYQLRSRAEADRLGGELEKGLGSDAFAGVLPMFQKGLQPFINQAAGRAAGRFGSRSGRVAGAIGATASQSLAPYVANLEQTRILENLKNLRMLFQQRSAAGAPKGQLGI